MEFVEGTPFKGPLPLGKAVEYAVQILEALDAAHRKGITHRDMKPGLEVSIFDLLITSCFTASGNQGANQLRAFADSTRWKAK